MMAARFFLFAFTVCVAWEAHAGAGVVQATFRYNEHNTAYCKANQTPSANCTDANYVESQFLTNRPLKRILVQLVRDSDGYVLATGTTNSNGVATISWWTLAWETVPVAHFVVPFQEGSGRFKVTRTNGGVWTGVVSSFQLTNGTTIQNPQTRPAVTFGSVTVAHAQANIYAAAEKWWDLVEASSIVQSRTTNIPIRWDPSANPALVTTTTLDNSNATVSVSTADSNRLDLIAHELGHVIYARACEFWSVNSFEDLDYFYDLLPPDSLHFFNSSEWRSVAFEEGFASFIVAGTLFGDSAVQPIVCITRTANISYCETGDLGFGGDAVDVEASVGAANCVSNASPGRNDSREEISAARYLWDVIDDHSDTINLSFANVIEICDMYPQGALEGDAYGNHGSSEPWNSSGFLDNKDGRSGSDFEYHALTTWSGQVDTSTLRAENCSP